MPDTLLVMNCFSDSIFVYLSSNGRSKIDKIKLYHNYTHMMVDDFFYRNVT